MRGTSQDVAAGVTFSLSSRTTSQRFFELRLNCSRIEAFLRELPRATSISAAQLQTTVAVIPDLTTFSSAPAEIIGKPAHDGAELLVCRGLAASTCRNS